MTNFPLRPELNAMLNSQRQGLPLGTALTGYELQGPDVVVLIASQPSIQDGDERKAAVRITSLALEDAGSNEPVQAALTLLIERAHSGTLPIAPSDQPAPMIAMYSSEGLVMYDSPISADE